MSGDGLLGRGPTEVPERLTEGALAWLPHDAQRSITAGADGLTCATVHRRRPGTRIGPRTGSRPDAHRRLTGHAPTASAPARRPATSAGAPHPNNPRTPGAHCAPRAAH
ncbi:hypothetical protein BFF78_04695 [Streptomyces fodineus]|uniref:Uncharacterized protein n=1 Tax=Streptomyces fodineus TaxID=1904616 RepID=A0A1D7Y4C5_9ACTN|nr:hypothetical protein BFF78_04695 [Streptomyces fodineus]